MAWGLVIAGIGAAAGVFNAFDEYNANRQIRADLDEIKKYLIGLRSAVAELQRQNTVILAKLDLLPGQIRQIVTEVVDVALLTERYSTVDDIRDNFLVLRGGRSYSLRSLEWLNFSNAMGYLFDHESRISKVFSLIEVCEIALVITKKRSLLLVIVRLDEKISALRPLFEDLTADIESRLQKLKIDLDKTTFIRDHNLSPDLPTWGELRYTPQPDREIEESYTEQECHYEERPGRYADRLVRVCRDVRRTRRVPDRAFHAARDAHVNGIRAQIAIISDLLATIGPLKEALDALVAYRDRITEGNDFSAIHESAPLYFSDDESEDALPRAGVRALNDSDFHDYIDGCHGDCESVEGLKIQRDNRAFFSDRC